MKRWIFVLLLLCSGCAIAEPQVQQHKGYWWMAGIPGMYQSREALELEIARTTPNAAALLLGSRVSYPSFRCWCFRSCGSFRGGRCR